MKKTAAIAIGLISALLLCSCGNKAAEETEAAETTSAAEVTEAAAEGEAAEGTTDIDTINGIIANLDRTEPESMGKVNTLGNYKGLELVTAPHVEMTDEDALDYLESSILPNYTEEAEDAIKDGDTANIDYEGKKDGVAFDGGTAQAQDLVIGSGAFIDGFESGLVGHKKGETVDLNLTFPEDYGNEELAGQDVVFTVKINSVTRQRELTDELAKEVDESCSTVEDLIKLAKDYLQAQQDLSERQELYYTAVQQVVDASDVTPDEKAVEYTTNNYIASYASSMEAYGLDVGTLLSYYGSTWEEFRDSYRGLAEEAVKQRAVLREIAEKEGLELSDEATEKFAESYGYTSETIKNVLAEDLLKQLVVEDMANQFIVDNGTVSYEEEKSE